MTAIFEKLFTDEEMISEAMNKGVRVRHIGRKDRIANLRPGLLEAIGSIEERTRENKKYNLVFALDYGGRDELVRAFRDITRRIKDGILEPDGIDEKLISLYLDTTGLPRSGFNHSYVW